MPTGMTPESADDTGMHERAQRTRSSPVKNAEARREAGFFVKTKYSKSQGFGRLGRKACVFARPRAWGLPLEIGL
jgi:hypothetical protein